MVECWPLSISRGNRQSELALALADGVLELLSESDQRVSDEAGESPRPLRPGDISVLCRKNVDCSCVAAEVSISRAGDYAGQLAGYAAALETATGREVEERWIHLALAGLVVPLEGFESARII